MAEQYKSVAQVAVPQRALPASIDELTSAVSALESTIWSLSSQLSPILDVVPCDNGCAAGQVIDPHQHYEQIQRIARRIRDLQSTASDLIARLHV